jgi:hypothetical protein
LTAVLQRIPLNHKLNDHLCAATEAAHTYHLGTAENMLDEAVDIWTL